MAELRNTDVAARSTPREKQLAARVQELEGALCVIEGMAERIIESKRTRDEIKAQVVRVLGTAPAMTGLRDNDQGLQATPGSLRAAPFDCHKEDS